MRSPTRSVYGRVAMAVVVAGCVSLGLAALGIAWVVRDDQEAALVDNAVRRGEALGGTLEHRLALARAELRAVALSADAGQIFEAPSMLSGAVLAVRCARGAAVLLEATSSPEAEAMLARTPRARGGTVELVGERLVVVRVDAGRVDAAALVDLSSALSPAPGESVRLSRARSGDGAPGTLIARRFLGPGGEEKVRVEVPVGDELFVTSVTSLAPARRAALETIGSVSLFSSLALLPLLLLAWLGARAVTRPVRALAAAVRGARGDHLHLPPLPKDEIGDLGAAIDGMSARLRHNAQSLRAAVSFSRRLGSLATADAVLAALERALTEALPQARWQVLSFARIARGERPVRVDVTTDALQRLLVSCRPAHDLTEESTAPAVVQALRPGVDGTDVLLLGLCDANQDHGVVAAVGRELDEEVVRHAELLARTAVAALKNQELVQTALTNERLLAAGRLAAGVAHEMNNPLAFVLANLQSVEPRLAGADREAVSDARQGAERLARIVRDLSSLSRGGSELQLAELDLAELARFVARVAKDRRADLEIVVSAPDAVRVRGDRGRLEQVLLNLVVNAVDATRDRPSPRVEVHVRVEGTHAVAEVVDNGGGVPDGARGKLFAPFFTTKGREGTGLGLYLSRSFAQAHGGDLTVAGTGPAGSTFALRLPALAPGPAGASRAPTAEARPELPSVTRVLVVDDEGAIVRGMTRWIGRRAEVTGCCNPAEALDLATRGDFALILCDLDMPGMSGTAFVQELRHRHANAAERVVIMTGSDVASVKSPVRVVGKPLSPTVLEELLRAH